MDKTKETFTKVFGNIKEKWISTAPRKRTIILAVAGVVVVSAIVITVILNSAKYTLLYTAADPAEAREVVNYLATQGHEKARIASGNRVMVLDSEPVKDLIMQLSMEGYPRDSSANFNTDVYNTGINALSTESDRQKADLFQLQSFLMATFNSIPEVSSSKVILDVQQPDNYVLTENKLKSGASVMLTLKQGQTLTRKQIDGVYNLARAAVPGLEMGNIVVTDGNGIQLIPSDIGGTDGEDLARQQQSYALYTEYKNLYTEIAYSQLDKLLTDAFGKYTLAVDVVMDYQNITGESTTYTPLPGVDVGIVSDIVTKYAAGGQAAEGGAIGTPVDSDISPTYPTIPDIAAGGDAYAEWVQEKNYKISEEHKKFEDNGLRVSKITASVMVDEKQMSDDEIARMTRLVANAIGTDVDNVTFIAKPFPAMPQKPGDGILEANSTAKNILVYIIILLGGLLVVLFGLAIMTSGSKKKRMVRYRGAAPVVDGAGAFYRSDMFQATAEDSDGFDLPSLVDNENETKDVVLKREIKEFSRSNPEIVAQLIRTWLRTDE